MPAYEELLPTEEVVEDVDLTEDETPETDEGLEEPEEGDAESSEGDGEGEPDGSEDGEGEEEPAPIGDGKSIPAELKELIKLHPDRAKLLKDLYFTNARYNKFGKVADLQKIHDYVNSYGSLEEAQKTKEQLDQIGDLNEVVEGYREYEALDQKFTAGDPAYVDHLATQNPDSFAKLAPAFLQRFGKDHGEQYNYLMSQVVVSTLINNGTANALSLLQQAAASGNTEQVKQIAAQIGEQFQGLQALSQRAPQIKTADPRVAQLEQEKQQLRQEQQAALAQDIKDRANTWASPVIQTALATYSKVKPALAERLDQDIKEEIGKILAQKPDFQNKIKRAFANRDREGALRLYQQYVTPLVTGATRKVAGIYSLKALPKKGTVPNTGTPTNGRRSQNATSSRAPQGFERVTEYPKPKDVRRDIPDYYEMAERDEFILKDGRKIKVVR